MEREPAPDVRAVLYRMAQEALANVHKHAEAEHVTVLLADRDGGVLARIADDGARRVRRPRFRARGPVGSPASLLPPASLPSVGGEC